MHDGAVFFGVFSLYYAEFAEILHFNVASLTAVMESLPHVYIVKL